MTFLQHILVTFLAISQMPQLGECSFQQAFFRINKNKYLANHVIEERQAETEFECGLHCVSHGSCESANFKTSGIGKGLCELNSKTLQTNAGHGEPVNNPEFSHLTRSEDNLSSNTPDSQTTGNKPMAESLCEIEDWSRSFNSRGWSNCSSPYPYIKGLYAKKVMSERWDRINNLEKANCCESFENVKSDCVEKDWTSSFDKKNHWNLCTQGYYLSGLYRSDDHHLENIEKAWCCKPDGAPHSNMTCYDEDVSQSFHWKKEGWVPCTQAGYYITGLYRSLCNTLSCIDKLKCCKF